MSGQPMIFPFVQYSLIFNIHLYLHDLALNNAHISHFMESIFSNFQSLQTRAQYVKNCHTSYTSNLKFELTKTPSSISICIIWIELFVFNNDSFKAGPSKIELWLKVIWRLKVDWIVMASLMKTDIGAILEVCFAWHGLFSLCCI